MDKKIIKYSEYEKLKENIEEPIDIFISGSLDVKLVIDYLKSIKNNEKKESIEDVINVLIKNDFGPRSSYEESNESIRVNLKDKSTKSFIVLSLNKHEKEIRIDYKLDKDLEDINNYIDYISIKYPSAYKKGLDLFVKIKDTIKKR